MLMTRVVYLSFIVLLFVINGIALWTLFTDSHEVAAVVPAALIINTIAWPIALIIAYRIGQVTGVEYFRKVRARLAALRASRRGTPARR
jgi:hypothetical protein